MLTTRRLNSLLSSYVAVEPNQTHVFLPPITCQSTFGKWFVLGPMAGSEHILVFTTLPDPHPQST
jgi:hypothetical protein